MFSKMFVKNSLLILILSVFVLSGCNIKVGEDPPPPANQEFGGAKCLSGVKPAMKAFIEGTAQKEDLEKSWDCIGSAIEKFKRYVRGRTADRYTSQELATFLENNFLDQTKNEKISPALQTEFMKVKQVFIGGNNDLTRDEIDKILDLIKSFREITINLNPYVKVLSLKWSVSDKNRHESDARFFEEANKEIQNTARLLASLIEKNGRSYLLSDFVNFMEELGIFFGEQWEFPKTIAKYMPVVKKVKKALAGGDENSIAPNEWGRFTLLGSRGYVQFLRYHYFIESVPETGTGYRLSYLSRTVEDMLSVFQDLVAEKPEGIVSREEVTDILKTLQVVWPDFKISDGLVLEMMKLKHLFFGGSTDSFATMDFATARLKVSRIKFLIERFLPYYTIYGREWTPDIYEPDEAKKLFEESQLVLEVTAREAGSLFEGSYDLKDFGRLMEEVENLYPPPGSSRAEKVKAYLPLVVEAKKVFLGGFGSSLTKSDWSVLLGFAARFYTDFLYYDYFIKGHSLEQSDIISNLSVLSNQTLTIFRDLLSLKEGNFITRLDINKIAQHLIKLEILPRHIKKGSLDAVIGIVLNNILVTPDRRIDGYVPNVLSWASIDVLRYELQIWLDTELFIAKLSEGWSPERGLNSAELIELLQKTQKEPEISFALLAGVRELILSANTPVPLTVNDQGLVFISNKIPLVYTAKSLRQLNMNRALARLLLQSFATEKARIFGYKGVSLDELQGVFKTVHPFLIEAGIMDPRQVAFASSRFREANIFTPHSDGNSLASYTELNDLVGMIWSGVRINNELRAELVRVCFKNGDEVKNSDRVSLSCLKTAYKDAMPSTMLATPEYIKFMKKSSKNVWAYYINNVLKAAGYVPNDKNMALLDDIALAPHVIQYIEMLYARFDKNKDGIISTQDAIRAFPAFKGVLQELAADQLKSGTLDESNLLDLFTYILRYGKPPETLKEKIGFVMSWRGKSDKWDVWADRTQLSEIMGYIADQVQKSNKAKKIEKTINPELSVNLTEPQL